MGDLIKDFNELWKQLFTFWLRQLTGEELNSNRQVRRAGIGLSFLPAGDGLVGHTQFRRQSGLREPHVLSKEPDLLWGEGFAHGDQMKTDGLPESIKVLDGDIAFAFDALYGEAVDQVNLIQPAYRVMQWLTVALLLNQPRFRWLFDFAQHGHTPDSLSALLRITNAAILTRFAGS